MTGPRPEPHAIGLWSTLSGAVVAIAAGSLLSGGICAYGNTARIHVLVFAAAQWLFAAGCLFAANQLWIERDWRERTEMFAVSLGLALPVLPILWVTTLLAFAALGGEL